MPHQSHASLRYPRRVAGVVVAALLALCAQVLSPSALPAAEASTGTLLCVGFSGCAADGLSDGGYHQHWNTMYWLMYSGRNCVNYAAYRMVAAGMPNVRPWSGDGNATNWGYANRSITDTTPRVGAVAWYKAYAPGAGSLGHVAYVERVISPTDIIISESNWGSDFDWREVTTNSAWPTGFIHFVDRTIKNTAKPTVAGGTPTVGQTLTARGGRWSPNATLSYQWIVGGAVSPTTASTFAPDYTAYGKKVTLKVTATSKGYLPSTLSMNLGPVAAGTMAPMSQPAVVGDAIVGQRLSITGGQFVPAVSNDKAYQWYADGKPIAGATARSYTPTYDVVGHRITASVTGSHQGYNDLTLTSAPTAAVLQPMLSQIRPAQVGGTTTWGNTLSIDPGTFTSGADVALTYRWMRDGQPIPGATRATYQLRTKDVGRELSVQVDAAAKGYRDLVTTYRVPQAITTVSHLKIAHTTTPGAARIVVTVGAPGVSRMNIGGTLTVQLGGQVQQLQVVHGFAVASFTKVIGGRRSLTVTYSGSGYVLGSRSAMMIRVAKAS